MYDRKDDPPNEVPQACASAQAKVLQLEWAQGILKRIPNLPKGKLRDTLDAEITCLLDNEAGLETQILESLDDVYGAAKELTTQCENLSKFKKPGPNDFQDICHNSITISNTIGQLIHRIKNPPISR